MWTPEYFVRYAELPRTVEGVTIPNDDGTFDIYINSLIGKKRQGEKLKHEIKHITCDHFYNDCKCVANIEAEANGNIPSPSPPNTQNKLPDVLFKNLSA
ncbi:MAG: hypothetical protein VB112_03025 [Oscillospiraceae bacterium]|nr:hypothetical protein [Oscillospiraceae bacterium]